MHLRMHGHNDTQLLLFNPVKMFLFTLTANKRDYSIVILSLLGNRKNGRNHMVEESRT